MKVVLKRFAANLDKKMYNHQLIYNVVHRSSAGQSNGKLTKGGTEGLHIDKRSHK